MKYGPSSDEYKLKKGDTLVYEGEKYLVDDVNDDELGSLGQTIKCSRIKE